MSTLLVAEPAQPGRVPPLANGDWLKRDELHRRHLAMGGLKKAETLPLDPDGLARSLVFPGLWLDAHALLRGDLAAILAAVPRGLGSVA